MWTKPGLIFGNVENEVIIKGQYHISKLGVDMKCSYLNKLSFVDDPTGP